MELALKAPDVFAAVSPWSAIMNPDYDEPLPERICPAVPYLFLLGENDWLCVDQKHGELEYKVTKKIAEFLKNLMKLYGRSEMRRKCHPLQMQFTRGIMRQWICNIVFLFSVKSVIMMIRRQRRVFRFMETR